MIYDWFNTVNSDPRMIFYQIEKNNSKRSLFPLLGWPHIHQAFYRICTNLYEIAVFKFKIRDILLQDRPNDSYKTVNIISQEKFKIMAPPRPHKQNPEVPPPPPPVVNILLLNAL